LRDTPSPQARNAATSGAHMRGAARVAAAETSGSTAGPGRANERHASAGLLAHGSIAFPPPSRAISDPVAFWRKRSPLTVAGTATDWRLETSHRVPISRPHRTTVAE
jgi:hypothetical protein